MERDGKKIYQVFCGNLAWQTNEESLRQLFSTVGAVANVRVMTDRNDAKKGYAFVEYEDPDAALSAITNLSNTELDGRRLRVGFSNNSGLEEHAKQRGFNAQNPTISGGKSLESVLSQLSIHEMYDIVAHLKEVAENKPEELRILLISHPQIAEAIVHMQVKIGMIKPLARDRQPANTAMNAAAATAPARQPAPLPLPPNPPLPMPPILPPVPPMYMLPPRPPTQHAAANPHIPTAPAPPPQPPPQLQPPYVPRPPIPSLPLPPPQPQPQPQPHPPPPAQPALGAIFPGMLGNSVDVMQQILQLTPEQIAQVEPPKRQMLLDLRLAILSNPALLNQHKQAQQGSGLPQQPQMAQQQQHLHPQQRR